MFFPLHSGSLILFTLLSSEINFFFFNIFDINYLSYPWICNCFLLFDINLSRRSLVFLCHHIYPSNVPEQGEDSPWTISHAKTFCKKILFVWKKISFCLFSYTDAFRQQNQQKIFTLTFLTGIINI